MLVVPVVFFSLISGVCSLSSGSKLGRIALKTIALYLFTTIIAIALAILFSHLFQVGTGDHLHTADPTQIQSVSLIESVKRIFWSNPIYAFTGDNMLQLIVISILIGSMLRTGQTVFAKARTVVIRINDLMLQAILWFMLTAPYGVFCLTTIIFAKTGFDLIESLLGYFLTVLFVLCIHWSCIYSALLALLARLQPLTFYKKMRSAMMFAFSVSSSNASIPVTLETCEDKLGVDNSTAAFVIPLGATINMDGTAIMQGVATVFVANLYGIHLGISEYLMVIVSATLASIGTAGVPSVGLITLSMIFQQVGLPVEGIAIILGVDRLLDMARTAVNIAGDCCVACVVAKSEKLLDLTTYENNES